MYTFTTDWPAASNGSGKEHSRFVSAPYKPGDRQALL
jgi:hypothetical protein